MKYYTKYKHANPVSPVGEKSLTDPQFLKDCDINCILEEYHITGKPPISNGEGIYADVSNLGSFEDVMTKVNKAKEFFATLPSDLRARFGHDPVAYFSFVTNPDNDDECIRLGIKERAKRERTAIDAIDELSAKLSPATPAEPSTRGEG